MNNKTVEKIDIKQMRTNSFFSSNKAVYFFKYERKEPAVLN